MRVRFWGTRGSLPVALTSAGLREKLLATLRAARGHRLATEADLEQVLSTSAVFGGRHLWRPQLVRRARNRRRRLLRLRHGQRAAAVRPSRDGAAQGCPTDLPHLPVPPALGPHHGAAVLRAGLHSRESGRDLRQPRRAGSRIASATGQAVVSGRFLDLRREDGIRSSRPGPGLRDRRSPGDVDAAAARR